MTEALTASALATLFTEARTHNGWLNKPVTGEQLKTIYELARMGPTSANCRDSDQPPAFWRCRSTSWS